MEFEINIQKVENGFIVALERDTLDGEHISQRHVFTRYSQVVKFLKENFNPKDIA
jgi:hypothetical protein